MSQIAIWRTLPVEPFGYWHHGVLCPDNTVIHFKSRASLTGKLHAAIVHTSLQAFRGSSTPKATIVYEVRHRKKLAPEQVVKRAKSCIGQRGYSLLYNNCENFARWCVVGDHRSYQIENLTYALRNGYRSGHVPGAIHAVARSAAIDMPTPRESMIPLVIEGEKKKGNRISRIRAGKLKEKERAAGRGRGRGKSFDKYRDKDRNDEKWLSAGEHSFTTEVAGVDVEIDTDMDDNNNNNTINNNNNNNNSNNNNSNNNNNNINNNNNNSNNINNNNNNDRRRSSSFTTTPAPVTSRKRRRRHSAHTNIKYDSSSCTLALQSSHSHSSSSSSSSSSSESESDCESASPCSSLRFHRQTHRGHVNRRSANCKHQEKDKDVVDVEYDNNKNDDDVKIEDDIYQQPLSATSSSTTLSAAAPNSIKSIDSVRNSFDDNESLGRQPMSEWHETISSGAAGSISSLFPVQLCERCVGRKSSRLRAKEKEYSKMRQRAVDYNNHNHNNNINGNNNINNMNNYNKSKHNHHTPKHQSKHRHHHRSSNKHHRSSSKHRNHHHHHHHRSTVKPTSKDRDNRRRHSNHGHTYGDTHWTSSYHRQLANNYNNGNNKW